MQSVFAMVSLHHLVGVIVRLAVPFIQQCVVLFPGAILVAVAVGRFANNRSPPKVGGPMRQPSCTIHQAHDFGGDRGGERSAAEAENAEGTPGTIL